MRLKTWEIEGICHAVQCVFEKNNLDLAGVEVSLFGSRTDDQKKGGDIDLLMSVPEIIIAKVSELKFRLNSEIQNRIGEQKIDLLIIDQASPKETFHKIALSQAQCIKKW